MHPSLFKSRLFPLALLALLTSGVAQAAGTLPKDYSSSHWAADATRKAFDYGIFTGYPDGTFRGERALTHYEAAVVAGRLFDKLAQDHITTQYAQKKDLTDAEQRYGQLVAQGKLDADSLRAEVDNLKDEITDLKKQKRTMMEAMSGDMAAHHEKMMPPPATSAPAQHEPEHRTKPSKPVAMAPTPDHSAHGKEQAKPAPAIKSPKKQGKSPSRLNVGVGYFTPQGGDADAGFTWAVNYNFRPTSQRSVVLGYNRADGLGAGTGAEVDFSQVSLTYLLKNPGAKSRLGYGLGVDWATVNLSTPLAEADETDLGWHFLVNYRLTPRFLGELRYSAGGTDLTDGVVSTGNGGVSLRVLTGAGL